MQYRSTTFSVGKTAKLIKFPGGEIKFYKWLRENGFLYHDNEPFQIYIDKGWFEYVLTQKHKVNLYFPKMVTRVTIKGLRALERLMKKHFPPCKKDKHER
jgi:phage antirepressor YoqD-like protein